MTALWTLLGLKPYVVDLSHAQPEPIDFAALKADGCKMVILKATEGATWVDPRYAERRQAAADAGLIVEAYHFATFAPVAAQIAHFLAVAGLDDKMRGALDFEPNVGNAVTAELADAMADTLDQRRGIACLRYTGAGWLTPKIKALTPHLRAGPIWWAKYGPMMTRAMLDPLGIDPHRIVLWQETESGRRAGVYGAVDESYWLGTGAELDAYPALPGTYPT